MTTDTQRQDIHELIRTWNQIEEIIQQQFGDLTPEEVYHLQKWAMDHALGLD